MGQRIVRWLCSPWLIAAVSLAVRAWATWDYQRVLARQALSAIPFLFESGNIAVSLATGHGFASPFRVDTGPTAWMTPLYPLLLAGIMRVFGVYTFASWVAAVSFNVLASSCVVLPLHSAARQVGGTGVAVTAAWLWAVFPNAVMLSYQSLWDTSLSALLGATLLWATLRVAERRDRRPWILYGLLWGVAVMANAAVLALLPFLTGWAAWRAKAYRGAALTVAVFVLCCVPWTVRNFVVFRSVVPLRSVLGLQLWVGNNARAKVVWLGEQHPIREEAERARYVQMGEIAYMQEKLDGATAYIFTHPAHEAELISGRFIALWAGGATSPWRDLLANPSWWFRFVLLFNLCGAVASFGMSMVLLVRRHPFAVPLTAYPLVFPWAYYMTLAFPRYRHPIDPVVMLLVALGAVTLVRRSIPRPLS